MSSAVETRMIKCDGLRAFPNREQADEQKIRIECAPHSMDLDKFSFVHDSMSPSLGQNERRMRRRK